MIMANLTTLEKQVLEKIFQMNGGYVLNFSDRTMGEFFRATTKLFRSHQANACNAEAASASECERAMRRRLCVFADVRVTTKRGYWGASVATRKWSKWASM